MKWGNKYPPSYVNRLYGMVQRNLSIKHRFICFTDNTDGLSQKVESMPLPELGVSIPVNVPGKWRKTALWQKNLFGLQGIAVFIDLDSVIVDKIDDFFTLGKPNDVILTRNWLKPFRNLGQTTLFRFPVGEHSYIHEDFIKEPQAIADSHQFEQHYVTSQIKDSRSPQPLLFWPEKWVRHYRVHCLGNNYLRRYFQPAKLPPGSRVIAFPGVPNPEESMHGTWNNKQKKHPRIGEHMKNLYPRKNRTKPSLFAHLKSYHHKCEWIRQHWRE